MGNSEPMFQESKVYDWDLSSEAPLSECDDDEGNVDIDDAHDSSSFRSKQSQDFEASSSHHKRVY